MIDAILEFLQNYWNAAIEILLLAVAFYRLYLFFRGTRGARVLTRLAAFLILVTLVSQILNLTVISWLARSASAFLAISLVVIFQPECRRLMEGLHRGRQLVAPATKEKESITVIADIVFELSSRQTGALIAIARADQTTIQSLGGVDLDSKISKELLLTIFSPTTPLHDGGVIIRGDRLLTAACTFPVSQREDPDYTFGQRHRAGLGFSEQSPVVVIVVSEETGHISICDRGNIERGFRLGQFETRLSELLL